MNFTVMKRSLFFFLVLGLIASFSSCENDQDENPNFMELRKTAYEYLTDKAKDSITISWKEAVITVNEDGDYLVRFNTSEDALLGPIVVLVDVDTKKPLSVLPRF